MYKSKFLVQTRSRGKRRHQFGSYVGRYSNPAENDMVTPVIFKLLLEFAYFTFFTFHLFSLYPPFVVYFLDSKSIADLWRHIPLPTLFFFSFFSYTLIMAFIFCNIFLFYNTLSIVSFERWIRVTFPVSYA